MRPRVELEWPASSGPSEWPVIDRAPGTRKRGRMALTLGLVLWIAVVDVFSWRTNMSIFYIIPLLLLARTSDLRHFWSVVMLVIGLTYTAYAIKKFVDPAGPPTLFLQYRLLNRSFVAVMLVIASWLLQVWVRWRIDQSDAELSDTFRFQDRENSETMALIFCAPLVVLIGAVDIVSPADYNLAILYPIPLLICAWVNSRRLLWTMLAVLLVMVALDPIVGPPVNDPAASPTLYLNRLVAAVGLVVATAILHFWNDPIQRDTKGSN